MSAKTREFTTKFTTKDALDPVTTLQIFMQKTDIEYSTFIISQKRIDVIKTYQRINLKNHHTVFVFREVKVARA